MSLDFIIAGFGDDKKVVLKDNITLEEKPIMNYKRYYAYISNIRLEPGVKCLVGILEKGMFKLLYEPPGMTPVLVKRDKCLYLSLNGYKCVIDLREEEIY